MTPIASISADQLARARRLVALRAEQARTIAILAAEIERARAVHSASSKAMEARLDFKRHPERLAGLAEHCQRNPPRFQAHFVRRYHWLLRDMIDPLPLLHAPASAARPHQVDFHALPVAARPYLLGPYIGMHQNQRFPELCLLRSMPSKGRLVIVQTGGPVDPETWRQHLPRIGAWLGGEWKVARATASEVFLVRHQPLPATIPFDKRQLKHGALFIGFDVTSHAPTYIQFADLSSGTYIPGAAGTGKTSALHVVLRSIFANLDFFAAVYLVDGKDGVAMARYHGLHPKIRVLYDEPDFWKLAADLNVLRRTRNAEQRAAGVDKATKDFVAVVVDELPTFIAKPATDAKKEHALFLENLNSLAMRGRSAGIRMFFITQSPVAEQIPPTLRANCATTIAFRLPVTSHATELFGTLDGLPDPRKLPTGQAIVRQGETGTIHHVQFPFAPLWNPRRPA